LIYKNTGPSAKTFYGVTFESGEIKEVNGRINHHKFIQVNSLPKEPPVVTDPPKKPDSPKPEGNKGNRQNKLIKDDKTDETIEPEKKEPEVALDTSEESEEQTDADKVNEDISKENNKQEETE